MPKKSPTKKKSQPTPRRTASKAASLRGPLPPYGVPIREAMARGDVREMRRVAASARKWLKEVQSALDGMDKSIKDLDG
ncbi:MAG TPA: DUF1843 domain-containing protein [Pyrinomonadaceae bacterium]|nr:DUF1843 domain-containing protein [Pyrinomonadaceae bacterium]